MVKKSYVPNEGDVIWIDFDPQAGHEQAGTRPAVVLSPAVYNAKAGMVVCCAITNQSKGYPFEVVITDNADVTGVVLADQIKCLDWQARNARFKGTLSAVNLAEVRGKAKALLGIR